MACDQNDVPKEFKELDDSLRCDICHDRYKAAVTIADPECGHSFCSECIRKRFRVGLKGLKRQASCPTCRFVVVNSYVDGALIPNRALQEMVHSWSSYVKTLNAARNSTDTASPSAVPALSSRVRKRRRVEYAEEGDDDDVIEVSVQPSTRRAILEKRSLTSYTGLKTKRLQQLVSVFCYSGTVAIISK
jgi:hypothetical protein